MVRSNSFDLTQNRKKKSMLQHKVKDEDFSIIFLFDFPKYFEPLLSRVPILTPYGST